MSSTFHSTYSSNFDYINDCGNDFSDSLIYNKLSNVHNFWSNGTFTDFDSLFLVQNNINLSDRFNPITTLVIY